MEATTTMKIVFALELLVLLVGCSQYVPIPQRSHGLTLGDPKGTLRIRAFYDLLCTTNLTQVLTPRNPMTTYGKHSLNEATTASN